MKNTKHSIIELLKQFDYECVVGLDLAIKAGVAVKSGTSNYVLTVECRDPVEQLNQVLNLVPHGNNLFIFEQLTYFRNAKVIKSLSERLGYFYHTVRSLENCTAIQVNVNTVRKALGLKNKEGVFDYFSKKIHGNYIPDDNHTDAMALVAYFEGLSGNDFLGLEFEIYKGIKIK